MSEHENLGGGGGGGQAKNREAEGHYSISANQVSLLAKPALPGLGEPLPPVVSLVAASCLGPPMGIVEARGESGVRITAGPGPGLPAGKLTTNGVEIEVSDLGSVTLQQGLLAPQRIEMSPASITIDAGAKPVTIKSLSEITIEVGGGVTKLRLSPEGITIEGLTVRLNGTLMTEVKGLNTQVTATAFAKLGGALTMIG